MQEFTAVLIKDDAKGGWTKFDLPLETGRAFGDKGFIKVKGFIDGIAFDNIRLMPLGDGNFCMAVKESLRKALGKGHGDTVSVEMEHDNADLSIPGDLAGALQKNKKANTFFDSLTESGRNYYVNWISGAKRGETRTYRIEKTVERLSIGLKFTDK